MRSAAPILIFTRDHEPTDAQARAGNYQKKHMTFQGIDIAVENPAGSVRRGVDQGGKPWETRMVFDYGYIKGSIGADKDHVDCYLGPNQEATHAYVIAQRKAGEWSKPDEDKVMLGFDSLESAQQAYLLHYNDPRFLGPVTAMPMEEFKAKVHATKDKPGFIKSLVLLFKGGQRNLFAQPVHVDGHMRDGVFVKPHTARRLKAANEPTTERPMRPDGRWVPREGDKVYQFVAGPFGMPAVINGDVQRNRKGVLRVRCTGGASLIGQAPAGKTFAMSDAWNVNDDPEIERRKLARTEKEAAEKAATEAARQAEAAEHARLIAESKEAGFTHLDERLPPRGTPIENVVTGAKGVFHQGGEYPTAIWYGSDAGAVTFPLEPVRVLGEPTVDTLAIVDGHDAENARASAEFGAQIAKENAAKKFWVQAFSASPKVDFGTAQLGGEVYGLTVRRRERVNGLEIWIHPAKGKAEKLPAYPLESDSPWDIKSHLERDVLADGAVVGLADGMTMSEGFGMIKSIMLFFKSRVRGHTRHTKDGKVVQVREHVDKRAKKQDAGPKQADLFAGKIDHEKQEATPEGMNLSPWRLIRVLEINLDSWAEAKGMPKDVVEEMTTFRQSVSKTIKSMPDKKDMRRALLLASVNLSGWMENEHVPAKVNHDMASHSSTIASALTKMEDESSKEKPKLGNLSKGHRVLFYTPMVSAARV